MRCTDLAVRLVSAAVQWRLRLCAPYSRDTCDERPRLRRAHHSSAGALRHISTALITNAGGIAPIVALTTGAPGYSFGWSLMGFSFGWLFVGVVLHFIARAILRRLRS